MDQDVRPSKYRLSLLPDFSRRSEGDPRVQIVGRVVISIIAIAFDVLAVPALYSARPFTALFAFAMLAIVSNQSRTDLTPLPRLTSARLIGFVGCHLLLAFTTYVFSSGLNLAAHSYSAAASLLAATKILVVLPSGLLFPTTSAFYRRFAAELWAFAIVLFIFFPDRHFESIWPWYSKLLTTSVALVCGVFVAGTQVVPTSSGQTVVGPFVDMVVDFGCSGITGMNLFHLVFGIVAIVEWNRLRKARSLVCFVVGGLAYVVANFIRLVLLFLIGNLVSKDLNLDFLGWVIFGITFYILMKTCYDWMVEGNEEITVKAQAIVKTA